MLSNDQIANGTKECINRLGVAYRLQLTYVGYSTGENKADNHIDIKIYDKIMDETGIVRIDNIVLGLNSENDDDNENNENEVGTKINGRNGITIYDTEVEFEVNDPDLDQGQIEDYESDNDSDNEPMILSDINQMSYESFCYIITDVIKAMLGSNMFSAN